MKKELLRDRETFHLEIPADENNLGDVRDFIADICTRAGFSKRETSNTKLAVDEACSNIIQHAYRGRGGQIRLDVQAEPGQVEINIFDRGDPFEWASIKDPDLDQYVEIGKKGGLGIYLMGRIMDELNYQTSAAGNRLYMMKSSAAAEERLPLFISIRPKWTATLRFKFGLRATLGLLGLVLLLWALQYTRQTRQMDEEYARLWSSKMGIAENLSAKSVDALVREEQYSVEQTTLNAFVSNLMKKFSEVKYAKVVNNQGLIVSSSNPDEIFENYEGPEELATVPEGGSWVKTIHEDFGSIQEYHLPVLYFVVSEGQVVRVGRVVIGFSEAMVESTIIDPRPMMALILTGVFVAGVLLIYLLVAIFVKPIQELTDGVRAIGEGSLEDEIKIDGPEEIGEIARAFNEITAKFRVAQKNVVEQERLQKEMQVAQEIQHSLLPRIVPKISGYDIASFYRAAKEVGGDYYDFVNVDEDAIGVVVADVSGKGVPGSLVMTMIRTALRMEARGNHSAAEVMAKMNDFVTEDMKKGMFVTIFYVILDSKNRIISYSSAGHNPMVLYRAESDETFFLNPRGFPVGISLPDNSLFRRSIDVEKIKLKKDDMLVIYTDGVTEAMNESRAQYGEERLIQLIKKYGRIPPADFIDRLSEDVRNFTGDHPQNDDITVVAIKEKLMADEVLYGIRKKLLDLVNLEGLSVAAACRRMKVSPSTYYRYKKRLSEFGERGLKNKMLRKEHDIRRVSLEQRKEILEIIKRNVRFGAKRIADQFNQGKDEKEHLSSSLIYDELKRMRLNTFERRVEYLRRTRFITEEEFEFLMSTPATKYKFEPTETGKAEEPELLEAQVEAEQPALVSEPGRGAVEELHPAASTDEAERLAAFEGSGSGGVEIGSKELEGGIVVLNVKGHLDSYSVAELEGLLESVYEYGYRKILVDLKEVSYISSGGWGIFTGKVRTLRDGGGDVVLVGMSPEVYDIYELLGFQEIIMHFQELQEAVEFVSLPFEARQEKLAELSYGRSMAVTQRLHSAQEVTTDSSLVLETEEAQSPWTPLRIEAGTVGEQGEITVLYLDGVVDTVSSMKLYPILNDLVAKGNIKLVIDMSNIEYVSSSGWGIFTSRLKEIRTAGGDIKIFGMDQEVDHIFHLLGFDAIMRAFSILAEAIGDFENPAPDIDLLEGRETERVREQRPTARVKGISGGESSLQFDVSGMKSSETESIILRLRGAVDASTTSVLEDNLERCMRDKPRYLVIDLSDVVYISSSGWGVMVKHMRQFHEQGGQMVLAGMSEVIYKIFRDLGFEPLIPHYISAERALEELVSARPGRVEQVIPREIREQQEKTKKSTPPKIEKSTILPLEPIIPEKVKERVIVVDFQKKKDLKKDTDKRIKKIGWAEYGEKLSKRDKKSKRRRR